MRVVVAGGTGFLGSPLTWSWAEEGHDVRVLTRALPPGSSQHEPGTGKPGITRIGWRPESDGEPLVETLNGADVVVNLAGESIGEGRWTDARKKALHDSRIVATRGLADAIAAAATPPHTLLSASGVGYYGDRGGDVLTETSTPGSDFLARLCVEWEDEARRAEAAGVRVVLLRSGLVFEKTGGALAKMLLPFKLGIGGRLGSGRQYLSWIHRLDWIEIVRWLVDAHRVSGPVNVTAPSPVTNAEFTRALARSLRRPALIPAPAFALRLALGEFADSLLAGQRAIPARAQGAGYHFRYPDLELALRGIFERNW